MTKHIGIFVDSKRKSGGAYQELLYIIKNFETHENNYKVSIIFANQNLDINIKKLNFDIHYLNMNILDRYISYLRNYSRFFRKFKNLFLFQNKFEKLINENKIDLVYFTGPSQYSLYLENSKFIITVPDVSHRENLEFPEMINDSEFERREETLKTVLPKAVMIITNANIIKERISFFYKVLKDRILVVNHQPSLAISNYKNKSDSNSIKFEKYNLPSKYLFYPAMYFPHKNHKTLIDALDMLDKKGKNISLVCCGNDNGYLKNLKKYANKKNLSKKIRFLGYVDDEDLPSLYLNSSILVMTSLIGPTNIPPWEAFKLGVPVIYPNLEGIKEIYEDCVLYYDPLNADDLASKIENLYFDNGLQKKLILNGKKKIDEIEKNKEFKNVILSINNFFKKSDL